MNLQLKKKFLNTVTATAAPLEKSSKSVYANDAKCACRNRRAAINLQLIEQGALDKGAYFGLPGDSFLMEELTSKLGIADKEKMTLIDRDTLYKAPPSFPKVHIVTLKELSDHLRTVDHEPISFADIDICSPLTFKDGKCSIAEETIGVWKHSKFVSVTVNAAREPGGLKTLKGYLDKHPIGTRVGGLTLGELCANISSDKFGWGNVGVSENNLLRIRTVVAAMREAMDNAGLFGSKLLVLDASIYNGTNNYPMLAMTFARDLKGTKKTATKAPTLEISKKPRKTLKRLSLAEIRTIPLLRANGLSMSVIAGKLNVAKSTVHKYIKLQGAHVVSEETKENNEQRN